MNTKMLDELYKIWSVDDEKWGIEIIQGKYNGAVIQIDDLKVVEKEEAVELSFHILQTPGEISREELRNKEFDDMLQCIISEIISNAFEAYDEEGV